MIDQLCADVWDFFFPPDSSDDLVLTRDEKDMIVTQITEVKSHLTHAKAHVNEESFDAAAEEVVDAINASTCGRCQRKMTETTHDIIHAGNICALNGDSCEVLKSNINYDINDFMYNYLPKVEEVLRAREE
jgi:hypothetical protein